VQQVNQLIGEIAVASTQQSSGVEEINRAIVQMEGVTQQNAALVEQAAAATLSFEEEARRLTQAVSRFELSETAQSAIRLAPAPASVPPRAPQASRSLRRHPAPTAGRSVAVSNAGEPDEWKEF
jgi:methyl-accepting chemotaxis protein